VALFAISAKAQFGRKQEQEGFNDSIGIPTKIA